MTFSKTSRFTTIKSGAAGPTTEQVVRQVRGLIERGELRPGDRLPAERELAKRLGISRPSLRASLRFLAALGVLESRHGSGTYIAAGPPTLGSAPLQMLAALHGFQPSEMFEARLVLEVSLAGLAAERATNEQLAQLAEEVMGMYASLAAPQQYLIHDMRFHRAVAAAAGNPILAALMEMVATLLYEQRRLTVERSVDLKESAELHHRIYRAIRARKPAEARTAMSEHLQRAERAQAAETTGAAFIKQGSRKANKPLPPIPALAQAPGKIRLKPKA